MSKKIRVAIAGVGNCASALVQGIQYYVSNKNDPIGLTAYNIGGFEPGDIEFVAAFDVVDSKVDRDLSEALFSIPNNTPKIYNVEKLDVPVRKAEVLDGVGRHLSEKVRISDKPTVNVAQVLKDSKADVLLNYLPVGSRLATQYYADQCLETGVGFINAIPVFIASTSKWQQAFQSKNTSLAREMML